jgi:CheY-like chemotaxis protein
MYYKSLRTQLHFVDDEPEILQNYKDYFEACTDFHVVIVNSPGAALLRAEKQIFDVICIDFRMPKLTGSVCEIAKKLANKK